MSDRIFGGIGVALSIFFIWQASIIELSFVSDPIGPKTFPIIIAALLGISSAVIMLKPDAEPIWPAAKNLTEIAISVGVLVAYAILLPEIGFLIATTFASGFLAWRLGTKPMQSAIAGICTSVGIYVVFNLILGLSLAKGPFGI